MNNASAGDILITVIIPSYNAEKYISVCLESVFALESLSLEVIVMDGGSTDDTLSILSGFRNKALRWYSNADQGIYDAMNKGIDLAAGKWLYFMGADDRLLQGFMELALQLRDAGTIYYGNSVPFYEESVQIDSYGLLQGEFSPYRLAKYCINHQSILYPAQVFRRYKYELKYNVAADYALNLLLWGDTNFKKEYYPIDIVSYNMGGFSAANEDHLFNKDKSSLIRRGMGWKVYFRYLIRSLKDKWRSRIQN